MTLIEQIKSGKTPDIIKIIAKDESVSEDFIIKGIADGTIVIPKNINRTLKRPVAVGAGRGGLQALKTKVNANIGTSPDKIDIKEELQKLDFAIKAGADAVMDLSIGGNLAEIRKEILGASPVSVGTVPLYEVACRTMASGKKISEMPAELMFEVIEQQAQQGVDFMTLHCGINLETVGVLERQGRLAGVVSRGGSFLVKWINANKKENPLYEHYDKILEICKKYDITISLGDGFRPGCGHDASDGAQIAELSVLGELVLRARTAGVQTMIEGPGHVPLNQIQANVMLAKRLGHNAPLYFLGPLVTDIAAGYDHITSAIGGAMAASYGVDFICYVTAAEHLRLPNKNDVYEGVISARIAGHAADIVKGVAGAAERDKEMSKFRKSRDWQAQQALSIDPEKFAAERAKLPPRDEGVCTMCSEFCAMRDE